MSSATLFTSPPAPPYTVAAPTSHHHPERLVFILNNCKSITQLRQIHAAVIRRGLHNNPTLHFKLQNSYSSLGRLDLSAAVFAAVPHPDVFSYTAIIRAHARRNLRREALRFYIEMLSNGVEPNAFTVSSLLKFCEFEVGVLVHGHAIKIGVSGNLYVGSRLIELYGGNGDVGYARKVFDEMSERNVVCETAMVGWYAKNGEIENARLVFDGMGERDVVSWNVMIDGYAQNGRPSEALVLFRRMLKDKVYPSEITLVAVLSSCGQLGALELGRWVHSYIVNNGIRLNVHVATALVDMYSKCGSLEDAKQVFDNMDCKDVVAWNSMIVGYAINGFSYEVLRLFDEMCKLGLSPTDITFVGVLNACAHGRLVTEGKELFRLMNDVYGLQPKLEHYGCMVNLLGRAGHLEEAYGVMKEMSVEPDLVLWGTLLSACRIHGNVKLGEKIVGFLVNRNMADDGTFVLLSNMYAANGDWDGVAKVRSMMQETGIGKEPGCSAIEVNNKVHEFLAGDLRHPKSKEIYMMLEEMNEWLKYYGHSPQTDTVLHDIGERKKEISLGVHSERLAIAYGLISTQPGSTIRIVKNLRVCSDCHEVTKLISKITRRRIVVRDRNRFHHFEYGSCSCGDYW